MRRDEEKGKRKDDRVLLEVMFDSFEWTEYVPVTEEEKKNPYAIMELSGVASKGGIVNKNRRLYPTPVLNRVAEASQDLIRRGKLLGEVDHPDWVGTLSKAAVKFTKLWMEGDLLQFEAIVLATDEGRKLATLLRSGVGVGVSTRGYGSTKVISSGGREFYEIQDDYELRGIDFVLNESNKYGKIKKFEDEDEGGDDMTVEQLKKDHPDVYEAIRAEVEAELTEGMNKDLEIKIAEAIEAKKGEFIEQGKQEALESEEIVQIKGIVEAVKTAVAPVMDPQTKEEADAELKAENESLQKDLTAKDSKIVELTASLKEAEDKLEAEATAKLVAEALDEKVKGHKHADALRNRLAECKTVDELNAEFDKEVAFLESVTAQKLDPKGNGKVTEGAEGDDPDKLTEEEEEARARARRLAGL